LLPYSTSGIGGPLTAGLPTYFVPPSGFGYPLDGFLPSIPCRSCFVPAALMGFTLRSFLLAEGARCVSARPDPHTVLPVGAPVPTNRDGPAQQAAVPGLWPFRESLATIELLTRSPLDAPVGFTLLGFCYESRNQDSARSPLTRFADLIASHQIHRRPRVSLSFRWHPPDCRTEARLPARATLLGFLHQSDPNAFERAALRDMCSPRTAPYIAAGWSALLR
jgi:hypothetical protein